MPLRCYLKMPDMMVQEIKDTQAMIDAKDKAKAARKKILKSFFCRSLFEILTGANYIFEKNLQQYRNIKLEGNFQLSFASSKLSASYFVLRLLILKLSISTINISSTPP